MSDDQEKKIVVDDDWKERVRKEREELRKKGTEETADQTADHAPDELEKSAAAESQDGPDPPHSSEEAAGGDPSDAAAGLKPPPASLEGLISMLATQAMVSMGVMPGAGGEAKADRDFAKHFIDLLGILEEKTQGNLTSDESKMLTQVLHDLRMGFVQIPG